jgi:TolB-like protein/Tfp pilus assembly protein PilF
MSAGAMRAGEWPGPSQPDPLSPNCQSGLAGPRHHTHLSSVHDHPPAPARGHCVTESFDRLSLALADRYRIERELGGGGMSRVFVAEEVALGRTVVVKVVAPELLEGLSAERFTREVRLAARLQQANIVPLLSAGNADGLPYYTMPFVEGLSLRARLAGGGPMTFGEATHILRDVARALAYAHAQGVVHRDIKPENVLISGGTAMVTDFGIAKALTASRSVGESGELPANTGGTLTSVGTSLGTPAYMAPEQAVGSAVDARADLYAWGVMAYELLTGAHPFAGRATAQQLVAAHIAETPAPIGSRLPSIPAPLVEAVMRCLEKDPAHRPASASELLTALDAAATPHAGVPSPGTSPARRRLRALGVAAAILVVAVGAWATTRRSAMAARATRGAAAATPEAAERSIAVLPLANLSGNKADDYFGIGLAEEITRALAKNGVRVIGRLSAASLQSKGLDELAIARELGVGWLLTGAVQHAGDDLRINVTLLSAGDGAVRWTEKYDRPLTNVFAVQDEIARTVASTLLGSLGPPSTAAAPRAETADPGAHALFLQGQLLFNRRGSRAVQQAIVLFEQAAARDPRYARAQASLAMALAVLPAYVQDSTPAMATRAIAAAGRAIAMDSTIAESYAALGYANTLLGERARAEASFRRALALDSTVASTWGWYGLLANRLGDYRAAHERIARALELEPASLIARVWEAQVLVPERRFAAADSMASAAIALDSTFMIAWEWRANALLGLGRAAEAVTLLERQVGTLPAGRPQEVHCLLAYAYAVGGRAAEARATLDQIRARSGGRLPATGAAAAALEELGDHEAAIALLTKAIARHDVWLVQFPRSPRYDRLRRDPRAAAMFDQLGRGTT